MKNTFWAGIILGTLIGAAVAFVFWPAKRSQRKAITSPNPAVENNPMDVHSTYEAPRIVLDEGLNASASTSSTGS